jgi:copper chaperone CopZ
MTHRYKVSGLTCGGCVKTVTKLLSQIVGVESVTINQMLDEATIMMKQHISTADLKAALKEHPKYQIEDKVVAMPPPSVFSGLEDAEKAWYITYKPILLIFAYITAVTLLVSNNWLDGMRYFMAGFFLVFSFFKLLNIRDFADSYAMYDIVAKRFKAWGFIYPFIELALGLAFVYNFQPILMNWATLIVMSVSAIGVIQSVIDKRKIKCACLGAVFNLPMSTVTIIEDLLMVSMSIVMLYFMA